MSQSVHRPPRHVARWDARRPKVLLKDGTGTICATRYAQWTPIPVRQRVRLIIGPPSYWRRAPWWKRLLGYSMVPDKWANREAERTGERAAYPTDGKPYSALTRHGQPAVTRR